MNDDVKRIAHSLTETGRVLVTKKAAMEQVLQQEAVSMLLGFILLADGGLTTVADISALELSRRLQPDIAPLGVLAMAEADYRCLHEPASGRSLVLARMHDENDWESLPVHLQNYVRDTDFPCHLALPVLRMQLPGDSSSRYYATPVFFKVRFDDQGRMQSQFAYSDPHLRAASETDPRGTKDSSAVDMEPYIRLLAAFMLESAEAAIQNELKAA